MATTKEQEINRKRKNSPDFQIPIQISELEEEDNDFLSLSLSFRPSRRHSMSSVQQQQQPPPLVPTPPLPPPPPPGQEQPLPYHAFLQQPHPQQALQVSPSHTLYASPPHPLPDSLALPIPPMVSRQEGGPSRPCRGRRNPSQGPREGKSTTVPAPFPWATTHRATVHSLNHLLSKQISTITGEVQCKRCEQNYEMDYDLREKFIEIGSFIVENKASMHDRAPTVWTNPILPTCKLCDQENSVKPIISEKKKSINWLFLLLGQMLGCCTLEQLKYFCKHTKNHRTGAKDRVLYLTYLGLCKQLDPNGPFNRS
ncbi:unnamed protein product [Ilex paraguariensis]|uniref:DUF7086 domain-containing protein n=1 Tax=Ilex paraguariensis TaxID=185542 RepID=A0ABC8R2S8_9AQUA